MDRDEPLTELAERGRIRARSLLPQGHDRKEADDADGDDGGFKDTNGDVAKGDCFVLPLDDREQRDGGADTGEGRKHLEERPLEHAGVSAGADDVARVVQHRDVENQLGWDRGDDDNNEEYARS
jgi:hypothetical protein